MSPHLIGLGWHPRSLLWPASGSGLDMIWKLKCQLRHIKWGLILKLSLRPFLSPHLESLRIFFHFMSPCRAVGGLSVSCRCLLATPCHQGACTPYSLLLKTSRWTSTSNCTYKMRSKCTKSVCGGFYPIPTYLRVCCSGVIKPINH